MMRTMAGPLTVISLFWYGSAHWQVTPSLSLISFTNSHVLYFFISFIFSLFLHSNAANILMFLILIPWYLFSVHILFRLNSDLANGQIEFDLQGGKGVYRQKGADAWLPFSNTLVLMDGTASAAFSGINVTRYSTFVLNNFDYSNYSKIRITNLGPYGYQVTCGTQLITTDGTYDVSSLASDKLQVLYRGDTVNPNIMLRIELIP